MPSNFEEAKTFLYRYGWATDTTADPVELLKNLVEDHERLREHNADLIRQVQEAKWSLHV
jgi:hypothetical protein